MGETSLTPLGLIFVVVMVVLIVSLPKRFLVLPMILAGCYITQGQMVLVGPLHFSAFRIVLLTGWLRLIFKREINLTGFNGIDKAIIVWVLVASLINVFFLNNASEAAIINRLGFSYDVLGLYFFFRMVIGNIEDMKMTILLMAFSILPLAALMIFERVTGNNPFVVFGGTFHPMVRHGVYRASGPFRSPIGAGTFGATLVPFFIALWWQQGRNRIVAGMGFIAAIVIVVMTRSGGPLSAFLLAIAAMALWKLKEHLKGVFVVVVIFLLYVAAVMKPPIWFLFAKLGSFIGGGGWHRAFLIEQAIKHLDEWWLFGTNYNAHWMPYALGINPDMVDMTNQYLVEGVRGGIISMALFIMVIVICFRRFYRAFEIMPEEYFASRILVWSMGAALFTHVVTFMSVSYFDQMVVFWYMLLAMIASVTDYLQNLKETESLTDLLKEEPSIAGATEEYNY